MASVHGHRLRRHAPGLLRAVASTLTALGLGGAATVAVGDTPATGASTPAASPAPVATTLGIEELVVTGKRPRLYDVDDVNLGALGSKDPLDVPISVQSYSATLVENQRARTLNDVLKNDPSIQDAAQGGAYDHIGIRGFAVDWVNTMRREGLSLAPFQDVPLENIDRIDVLKGPSGFLYGYNSPGGTVNYLLKRPTTAWFAEAGTELRSDRGGYAHLDSGGPVGAGVPIGYRLNVAGEKVGNFRHNGDLERWFASAAFDWKLGGRVFVRLDADYQGKNLTAQRCWGPR